MTTLKRGDVVAVHLANDSIYYAEVLNITPTGQVVTKTARFKQTDNGYRKIGDRSVQLEFPVSQATRDKRDEQARLRKLVMFQNVTSRTPVAQMTPAEQVLLETLGVSIMTREKQTV